jgi:ribonuclease HII
VEMLLANVATEWSYSCTKEVNTIGVDEVGRGPLAGPVTAAAVILPENWGQIEELYYLNDSKKLSASRREKIYSTLIDKCLFGIAFIEPEEIDRINILQASFAAMKRAIDKVIFQVSSDKKPIEIFVDGNQLPQGLPANSKAIVKGDSLHPAIAAASVIAKVERDRYMKKLAEDMPEYDWASNAGYGTAKHIEAIQKYGITIHHRKTFEPVKSLLKNG